MHLRIYILSVTRISVKFCDASLSVTRNTPRDPTKYRVRDTSGDEMTTGSMDPGPAVKNGHGPTILTSLLVINLLLSLESALLTAL